MRQKTARATIKEVAPVAGVSTQTVSRVINERPDVAPETRRLILEIIERLVGNELILEHLHPTIGG